MPPVSQLRKPAVATYLDNFRNPQVEPNGSIRACWRPFVNELKSDKPIREESATELSPSFPLREIDSSSLLQGEKEILIRHGDEVYRLRLTRNGKLILQK